jgi:tetratricopeptide (TPR) repeat protein
MRFFRFKAFPVLICGLVIATGMKAQRRTEEGSIDPLSYGVVLDDPKMKDVKVKTDLIYYSDKKGSLHFDLYYPPQLNSAAQIPAIIFLNAIGEREGAPRVKSWGIYSSWPRLVAAKGYIGISMETDGARIQESIAALFNFLTNHAYELNIDADRLGVYAASANVTAALKYLMETNACTGIRAAVMYYGGSPSGPFRKDLPVMFVVSEGDAKRWGYSDLWNEVLKNNAPWTIVMGTHMPHAFDAYSDNDNARLLIKQTIDFWKDCLDPIPEPSFPHSLMRDVFGYLGIDPSKALVTLEAMAGKYPENVRILSFYAGSLKENGRQDQAAVIYQKILSIDPGYEPALISLTAIAYAQNDSLAAEKYISTLTHLGKPTAGTYGDLGFILLAAGRDREAAIYYEKAVALQPNGHDYYNLACAYARYGEKDKAFSSLSDAINLGFGSRQSIENDVDLKSLKSDSRFQSMLENLK